MFSHQKRNSTLPAGTVYTVLRHKMIQKASNLNLSQVLKDSVASFEKNNWLSLSVKEQVKSS